MQNRRLGLALVSEGCAGIYPGASPPSGGPPSALGSCLRDGGSVFARCLSAGAAWPGLLARVLEPALGWRLAPVPCTPRWDGVGWVGHPGAGVPARATLFWPRGPGCCEIDAAGCRTVPKPCWDVGLWGVTRLPARWLHPQLPGGGNAWLGWLWVGGRCPPHCSTGERPWGCVGLGVVTRVLEEPPPAPGQDLFRLFIHAGDGEVSC